MSRKLSCRLRRSGLLCVALVGCVSFGGARSSFAQGTTTTIALEGGQAGGTSAGALFDFFAGFPVLNDAGQTAYFAFLQSGAGGVDSTNEEGIWRDQTLIARSGDQAGGTPAGVLFGDFDAPVLNDAGQTAYRGFLRTGAGGVNSNNDRGIWHDQTLVAREGDQAGSTPFGALFSSFDGPAINDSGQTLYRAFLQVGAGGVDSTNDIGIWRDQTLIARKGIQAGGSPTGALFNNFGGPVLNNVGQTAFQGSLQTGAGGVDSTNDSGIWRGQTLIAREGFQAGGTPTGAQFNSFHVPVLNDAGQTAYLAFLQIDDDTGGVDSTNDIGIWRDQTLIAREGFQAGGTPTGALFDTFGDPVLNDAGQTAFSALLQTGAGGVDVTNDQGIWRDQTLIAREGFQAPGLPTGALFGGSLGHPVLNDAGQLAFPASLKIGTGGVDVTNNNGIWITGTGGQSLLVARRGDSLAGRTISSLSISSGSGGSDGQGRSLNNFSQLAYKADFTNGDEGIFLFTPEIHWTSPTPGSWDSASNWTIGQLPGDPHDVFIAPAASQTVTGPTSSVTVTNLTIGGNNGIATLSLNGGTITSPNAVVVTPTGLLTGDGVINGNVTNNGTVTADNVTITGTLTNNNLVRGTGHINAQLINNLTGEVRVGAGESLVFIGSSNSNAGRIEAIGTAVAPAEIEFDGAVTNDTTTGLIAAENATLRFDGGMTNDGAVAVSFGTSRFFGDISNNATGTIAVAGNSNITFYDDVTNSGTLNVHSGSTAVFFGALAGNGNIGGGDIQALGDLLPGASPGLMTFGGDLTMGPLTNLEIELGGLVAGSEFDMLDIAGDVSLAGVLDVSLFGGFALGIAQEFEIIDAGSLSGMFAGLTEGALVGNFGGTDLFISYVGGDGSAVSLFTSGLLGDYNGNGIVDAADYTVWRDALGGTTLLNDSTPGTVDASDYAFWKANFGLTAASGSGGGANDATVPEPGTLAISVFAVLALARYRRRR